jgi:hypothetical protein
MENRTTSWMRFPNTRQSQVILRIPAQMLSNPAANRNEGFLFGPCSIENRKRGSQLSPGFENRLIEDKSRNSS